MRWALALIAVLMFGVPAAMAAKGAKNPPGKGAVVKANNKVEFEKEGSIVHTFAGGKTCKFTPANLSHFNQEEMAVGQIIGKLETARNTKDGLDAGTYRVFIDKPGNTWRVFFLEGDKVVGQSDNVDQGLDNEHKPKFADAGNSIRYWKIKFSY